MDIGVFGGSFDPIHVGHLIVAESAAGQLGLDAVRFVPTHTQPFKQGEPRTPGPHRLEMVRLALAEHPSFVVDDREMLRGGVSYTIDTVRNLRHEFPDDRLFLMVGADAAADLPDWREAAAISELATIVALSREGSSVPRSALIDRAVTVPAIGISATRVRARVRGGESIRYIVPESVRRYIVEQGLYRDEG